MNRYGHIKSILSHNNKVVKKKLKLTPAVISRIPQNCVFVIKT